MHPAQFSRSLKFICSCCFLLCLVEVARATPVAVPTHIWVEGTSSGTQSLTVAGTFLESAPSANDGYATDTISGSGALVAELDTVRTEPGRSYQVQISGTATPVAINVAPPPGFFAEIEGIVRNRYLTGYGMVVVRILPYAAAPPRKASSDVTDASGKVDWHVSLGSLRNGGSAGELSLVDAGFFSSWAPLFTPALLDFEPPSAEVDVYRVNDAIRQVIANETVVDVVTLSSTAYEIRFYNPTQMQGTSSPHTFTGQPYTVYTVEQGATATTLKITRKTYNITNATQTGVAAARSEIMLIERSGTTWPNFDWTHTPWTQEGQTALTQRYVDSGGTSSARTESAAVRVPGSTSVLSASRSFAVQPWGETLVSETLGTANSLTATFDYYTTSTAAGYTYVKSWTGNSGDWEAYEYQDDITDPKRSGTLKYRFRPYLDSPTAVNLTQGVGEVTHYDYSADAFGFLTRPTLVETRINGTLTAKTTIAYSTTTSSNNSMALVVAVRKDYTDSTKHLDSRIAYYREDITDPFFRNQLHLSETPEGGKTSYAYQRGTWNGTTFTKAGTKGLDAGTASRITAITGSTQSAAGTLYTTYDGYDISDIYLVDGKSNMAVTIRDSRALVVRTENYVWKTGAWQLLGSTSFTYNFVGQLTNRVASNGGTYDASYDGRLLTSETDEAGIVLNYTYDVMGRRTAISKVSGPTTTYTLDATGRVLAETRSAAGTAETIVTGHSYDDAGRVTSTTPPGLSATTVTYDVANRSKTTTAPDGATTIEVAFRDGRPKQVSGTATVPQYYTYSIETDGRRFAQVNSGTAASPRLRKTWSDWLGRVITSEKPGYSVSSQASSIDQNFYDATKGYLVKVTHTGLASDRYGYDAFGSLIRSGVDIDNSLSLDPSTTDRITDTDTFSESYAGNWWSRTETKSYLTATPFVTSVTRRRLTGNPANRLAETQSTDAEGNLTTTTFDVNRSTKTVTTTTTRTGFTGSQTQISVNGLVTSFTGYDSLTTTTQYDPLGRAWKSTDSRGNVTTTAYVAGSALVYSVTDAAGNILRRTGYDGNGRTAWTQDAAGQTSYFAYNLRGQLWRQWGAAAYPIEYGYDATYGDRISMSTFRAGSNWTDTIWPTSTTGTADTTTWTYDAASGLLREKTDASGQSVDFDYNVRGQTVTRDWARLVTSGANTGQRVRTTYGYDSVTGELTSQTYNDGTPAVGYVYNRLGQMESATDTTGVWDYIYDPDKPWRQAAAGLPAFYDSRVYTPLYETTGVIGRYAGFQIGSAPGDAADLEQAYTYTGAGRFDSLATKRTNNTVVRTFQYGYETDAPLVKTLAITGSHPFTVTRSYEAQRDLLSSIETKWSTASRTHFEYAHNALYQRVSKLQTGDVFADYGDATYDRYVYNARGELTQAPGYLGSNIASTAQPLPGRFHEYNYDSIGNRKSANRTGVAGLQENYTANALNQYSEKENNTIPVQGSVDSAATTVTVAGGAATAGKQGRYWADEVTPSNTAGPWIGFISLYAAKPNAGGDYVHSATRTAQIAKALQTFTYDADGNMISDGMWDYQYDAENRLVRMETTSNARTYGIPHRVLSYRYDFKGRRVQKQVIDGATSTEISCRRYLYVGWNLVAEWNAPGGTGLGTLVRTYTWGLDLTGDLTKSGGVGGLLQICDQASGKTYLPAYDGNGNVAALLDGSTGALAAAYEYDPFGNLLRNEVLDSTVADQPFRFSTKFADQETGLVYYGHRYYTPSLGRFVNRDPIEESGGLNLYGFCGNNGINAWDALGDQQVTFKSREWCHTGWHLDAGDHWVEDGFFYESSHTINVPDSDESAFDRLYRGDAPAGDTYEFGVVDNSTGSSLSFTVQGGNLANAGQGALSNEIANYDYSQNTPITLPSVSTPTSGGTVATPGGVTSEVYAPNSASAGLTQEQRNLAKTPVVTLGDLVNLGTVGYVGPSSDTATSGSGIDYSNISADAFGRAYDNDHKQSYDQQLLGAIGESAGRQAGFGDSSAKVVLYGAAGGVLAPPLMVALAPGAVAVGTAIADTTTTMTVAGRIAVATVAADLTMAAASPTGSRVIRGAQDFLSQSNSSWAGWAGKQWRTPVVNGVVDFFTSPPFVPAPTPPPGTRP